MRKLKYTTFLLFIPLLIGCVNTSSSSSVHTHTYSDKMLYDDTHHWYEVTCEHDDAANKEAHTFKSVITEATGLSGGYTTYTCEKCGYSYTGNETDPLTYTITWKNYDGSTLETDENVPYGTTPSYDGPTPTKPDNLQYSYTWSGWTPSTESVTSDAIYVATFSDTLVNAKISFDLNGGTTSHSTESFYSPVIESEGFFFDVKKEDYNFRGWSYNGEMVFDHKGNKLSNPSIEESMTFKAEFAQNVILTIYSNIPNAGEYYGEGTYEYNTNVDVSAHPNQGYSFVGWYYNNTLLSSQELYKYMMWSEDVTLEARFRINLYNLHVESEQPLLGQVMIKGDIYYEDFSDHSVSYLDSITISAYTKTEEYRFLGWYDSAGELVTPNAVYTFVMTNYDYNLYARWDSLSHNLIVTSNNETDCTITGSGSYKYGSYVTVEINYSYGTFEGWYDSNDNLMSKNKSYTFIMPNNELHLEAKWIKDLIVKDGDIWYCNSTADSITIPNSVTGIRYEAFYNCSSLTSVTFEEGSQLTSIGKNAFYNCTSLTSIVIPDSVTSIGAGVFHGCSSLTSITLPFVGNTATSTDSKALFGYIFGTSSYTGGTATNQNYASSEYIIYYIPSSLKEVTILGGDINYGAFYNCSSLESITIGDGVTSIGDYAFSWCNSLTSITIPNSVTSISEYAFCGCESLTSITIPNSVTSISKHAFSYCSSLTIYCEVSSKPSGWDTDWNYSDRPVYWGVISEDIIEKDGIQYVIVNGEATITRYVGNDSEVVIPSSIEINGTTYNVKSIKKNAFSYCRSLTSIVIPDSVTSIGAGVFHGCSSLTSITLPFVGNTATSTDSKALFGYIFGTSSYTGGTATKQYYGSGSYSFAVYYIPSSLKEVIITGGTTIGYGAFDNCSSLTSIVIPDSVTTIGSYAFKECSSLTSVVIPYSVTSIGGDAFSESTSLENVFYDGTIENWCNISFSDDMSNPMYYAYSFYLLNENNEWYEVTRIEISNTVTRIGKYQFYGFDNVTEIIIPNSVTSIGESAFEDCSSLTIVTFEEGSQLTSIGNDAFYNCTSLTSIVIPDSVTYIGERAFYNCRSLTTIVIPNSVTSIGYYAFSYCSSLTIFCEASSEPSGWHSLWNSSNRPVYWAGQWKYDAD